MAEKMTQRMTPERYAECLGGDDVDPVDLFKIAMSQAHAEGRAEGLRQAAKEAVRLNDWGGYVDGPSIARRIHALLAAGVAGQPSGGALGEAVTIMFDTYAVVGACLDQMRKHRSGPGTEFDESATLLEQQLTEMAQLSTKLGKSIGHPASGDAPDVFWLAERPGIPLYASADPQETCGDVADVFRARRFRSRDACDEWIYRHAPRLYVAREHAVMAPPIGDAK
jgi:hypothetical protein